MTPDSPLSSPTLRSRPSGVRMVPGNTWIRAVVDVQVVVDAGAFLFVWEIP